MHPMEKKANSFNYDNSYNVPKLPTRLNRCKYYESHIKAPNFEV